MSNSGSSTLDSALDVQKQRSMDYLKRTCKLSGELIQMLALQDVKMGQFKERLERQRRDLEIAERVTTDGLPDEVERVARQRTKLEATKQALKTFESSANILAGSVFQIAKQGMSIAGKKVKGYSNKGRVIAGICVRDIVWQGRNQAMHYEATATEASWRDVFLKLDLANPGAFSVKPPYESRAKAIFDLLGWQSHAIYEADMHSLLLGTRVGKKRAPAASAAS